MLLSMPSMKLLYTLASLLYYNNYSDNVSKENLHSISDMKNVHQMTYRRTWRKQAVTFDMISSRTHWVWRLFKRQTF